MLLVGIENVRLRVQAERLVQHPFASQGILLSSRRQRLVAAAGQHFSIPDVHAEAELLRLGGLDIKKNSLDFLRENTLIPLFLEYRPKRL